MPGECYSLKLITMEMASLKSMIRVHLFFKIYVFPLNVNQEVLKVNN